jgi:hypothetical protein
MATYYFDEGKAQGVCERLLAKAHRLHKGETQADIDGFWRVLRSEEGQAKLAVHEPQTPHGVHDQRPAARRVLDVVATTGGKASVEQLQPVPTLTPLDEEDMRDG